MKAKRNRPSGGTGAVTKPAKVSTVQSTLHRPEALSKLQLAVDAASRRELVVVLADEGMSNRAIAQAMGVSEGTVRNDKVRNPYAPDDVVHTPRSPKLEQRRTWAQEQRRTWAQGGTVVGLDGKTYATKAKTDAPERDGDAAERDGIDNLVDWQLGQGRNDRAVQRRPIIQAFRDQSRKVTKAAQSLENLSSDDRFSRNAEGLAYYRSDLERARDRLQRLIEKLPEPGSIQ